LLHITVESSTLSEAAVMRWVTRERAKVDRIACPWLIKKFVDSDAEFVSCPTTLTGAPSLTA
jgi:hypothetical protein